MAKKRGRPTDYTEKTAREICERLAAGESLLRICKDDHMPAESTVRGWVIDDREGFSARYARARDMGLDHRADETLEIADDENIDPQDKRVRFDARRWYLSKLAPKRYGDKVQVGGDPDGAPIRTETNIDPSGLSDATLAELMQARKGEGG